MGLGPLAMATGPKTSKTMRLESATTGDDNDELVLMMARTTEPATVTTRAAMAVTVQERTGPIRSRR